MKYILTCVFLLLVATPAAAQIQGGPNIAPNGTKFTYSPRFGYIGPPAAFVPWPPPEPTRYGIPGSMPTYRYPRTEPLGAPPMSSNQPDARDARPIGPPRQARRPPVGRKAPNVPCPAGCPREPDDLRPEDTQP